MEELITRIADNVGIEGDVAEKAVGMMLGFLQKEGDGDAESEAAPKEADSSDGGSDQETKDDKPADS